ncbi:MAG: Bug family tripartite tricarboxylate transporter substrate binding protein, partial [Elioraea tepidiphila]
MRRRMMLLSLSALVATRARAQSYPTRPVRFLVPFIPGSAPDVIARQIAERLSPALGQPVVVENRGGAGGSIGAGVVAQAPADGHTILLDAGAHVVNPAILRGLPFDYATAFAPITQVTVWPQLLVVNTEFPARTLAEFVQQAKTRQGGLSFGSSGNATSSHLAGALFAQAAGFELVH